MSIDVALHRPASATVQHCRVGHTDAFSVAWITTESGDKLPIYTDRARAHAIAAAVNCPHDTSEGDAT